MYQSRYHAGTVLAQMLDLPDAGVVVLAIPRGGVAVAAPVASKLGVLLDVLVTRKIGHPANREVAIGSVMPDGTAIGDEQVLAKLGIAAEQFREMADQEKAEIERRLIIYTGSVRTPQVKGKTVVLIDDGIATGYTVRAAIEWLRKLEAGRIMVAVPVAPPDVVAELQKQAQVICPIQADNFMAVGMYYEDFGETTDEEVLRILKLNTEEAGHKCSCVT